MRVVFVGAYLAGPAVRGDQVRARRLLRGLARRHSVTVVDIGDRRGVDADYAGLPIDCERYVPLTLYRSAMAFRAVAALPSKVPLQAALYESTQLKAKMRALVTAGDFDLAHVQLARLAPLLVSFNGMPVVLDFIDALSRNMRNRAAYDKGLWARLASIEAGRMARYERALCRRVDAAIVCAPSEREAIGRYRNLHVVTNGVDLQPADEFAPDSSEPRLVFTGNLGYFPNVDAATWFIEAVMPLLRADIPGLTLELAGARPARQLVALVARHRDVILSGDVDDIHPRIARATIAIAPLRAGSGQQTKVLEAMASGTPVVATSASVSGLEAVDGEHLLLADTPEAMREAIVRLLRQWPLRMRLADAGRKLVEARYRWDDAIDAVDAIWQGVARRER